MTIVAAIIAFGAAPALALWWWMADSLKMKVQSGRNDDDAARADIRPCRRRRERESCRA